MIIGSASRYLGGRGAVQTVYWRMSKKDEKLVKYGRHFNLAKVAVDESQVAKARYSDVMTSCRESPKMS